ncbi:hypothetical protein [Oceanobacillus kapialis]|uniref:DUF5071 domain-containing protein n=1 Tax=Oceanobacillus kapialis TaxID=481353 RepID=A0ABW5PZ21_9BACI
MEWAKVLLWMDIPEVNKLASMEYNADLNIFEIEKMHFDAMTALQWEAPTKEACVQHHLTKLYEKLRTPHESSFSIVQYMYKLAIEHDLPEIQMQWQEISDMIDEMTYGSDPAGLSQEVVEMKIQQLACELWREEETT